MSYYILIIYSCLDMFHTYNLHRYMQSYTFLSYHGSFKVIYIFCTYLTSMNNYCYHDCLCNIYTNISLICIRSHICSVILRFSYFSIIHIFHHVCIYSFLYSYHTIVYSYMPIIRVHVLIPGNILYLVNLYLHALYFRLSYLMTYTYAFLYLYVLLLLYQTVLSSVGVQNKDFFFNTLRYP